MLGVIRALVGICLVLFIVAIVVSPYVELPLTTTGVNQVALWLFGAVARASAVASIGPHLSCDLVRTGEQYFGLSVHDRDLLGLTCALLC